MLLLVGVVEVVGDDDKVVTRLADGSYFGGKLTTCSVTENQTSHSVPRVAKEYIEINAKLA